MKYSVQCFATLHEVKVKFALAEAQDEQFFWECKHNLPDLPELSE